MKQHIGTYTFDALTREEARADLKAELGTQFTNFTREQLRGIKPVKLPIMGAKATSTVTNIPTTGSSGFAQCGPELGYFWSVRRITVTSDNATDAGTVSMYVGSDTTEFDLIHLVDRNMRVGTAYYPSNKALLLWPGEQLYFSIASTSGNTYRVSGVAVEVPAEMVGKILG
jgi:hypothetical protein